MIGHARPDGDCVGSQIAASGLLAHFGENFMANADRVPHSLRYLQGSDSISIFDRRALGDAALLYVDWLMKERGPKTSISLEDSRQLEC